MRAQWITVLAAMGLIGPPRAHAAGEPLAHVLDSAEDAAVYRARFAKLSSAGESTSLYDTLESVPGAKVVRPLPLAASGAAAFSAESLQAAKDYAGRMNSNALMLWRDGRVQLEAYFGDFGRDSAVIGRSLSKPLAAIAIGRAIALGRIRSLDQPLADFLPEWRADPRRSRILVRHMLDMRTGFLRQSITADPDDILNRAYLHPRHDEILLKEYPVPDEPGSVYEYSNATGDLAALVIERATGHRYAEFLSTEVLAPIGAQGGQIWIDRPGGLAHSGCCILLPAETWLRLGLLVLQDGRVGSRRILPPGFAHEMAQPTRENPYYGLGLYVAGTYTQRRGAFNPKTVKGVRGTLHSEPYLARDLLLFDGNANQVVYIIPSQNMVVLRTGSAPARGPGAPEWDNAFLPNTLIRGIIRRQRESVPQSQK